MSTEPVDKTESRRWMNEAFSRVAAEEVRIDKCTVVPGGYTSKSYTTYDVKVIRPENQGGTTVVARRYSEFEKTIEAIRRRYGPSGLYVPPLPMGSKLSTQDDAFRAKRMRGLAICLNAIHHNIFMRYDPLYTDFVNPPDASNGDVQFVCDGKTGDARWEEFLPTLPTTLNSVEEDALEKKLNSLTEETNKFATCGENMVKSLTAVYTTLSASSKAFADLEISMYNWSKKEQDEMPMMNDSSEWPSPEASLVVGASPPVHHTAANVTTCSNPLMQTLRLAEEQTKETVRCLQVVPLEYMLEMNTELKRVLGVAANLKKQAAVKWAAYHKLQAKPVKAGANALEEEGKSEVELSKDAATEATAEWTNFVRVLLLVSLPTLVIERSKLARECVGSFAMTFRLLGVSVADNAMHFFTSLNEIGAAKSADSGNWSLATCTATANNALIDSGGACLNSFNPGVPETAAEEKEGEVESSVATVAAGDSVPDVSNALSAPAATPAAVPAPKPVTPEPTPAATPPEVPAAPPSVPAAPAATSVTDSLFGDSIKAENDATADLFGDEDGAC